MPHPINGLVGRFPVRGAQNPILKGIVSEQVARMILLRIGSYETNDQILDWLHNDVGLKEVDEPVVKYFRKTPVYQNIIEGFRDKYESEIIKVELASKRRRIEELSDLFYQAKSENKIREAREILAQLRIEREGNEKSGDTYQFNQFNAMPDSVLLERQKANSEMIENLKKRNEIILEAKNG